MTLDFSTNSMPGGFSRKVDSTPCGDHRSMRRAFWERKRLDAIEGEAALSAGDAGNVAAWIGRFEAARRALAPAIATPGHGETSHAR